MTSALPAAKNKILDVNSLVKKTDYNIKISEIEKKVSDYNHDEYIATTEFNKLAAGVFTERLAGAGLVTRTDFDTKLKSLNKNLSNSNKTKHLLVKNELKKLQTFDSSYFQGKSDFENDGTQNYLVFQPM